MDDRVRCAARASLSSRIYVREYLTLAGIAVSVAAYALQSSAAAPLSRSISSATFDSSAFREKTSKWGEETRRKTPQFPVLLIERLVEIFSSCYLVRWDASIRVCESHFFKSHPGLITHPASSTGSMAGNSGIKDSSKYSRVGIDLHRDRPPLYPLVAVAV